MKKKLLLLSFTFLGFLAACNNDKETNGTESLLPLVDIVSPEPGYIYLDGNYTGYLTPHELNVDEGPHVIGVALQDSRQYLRKEIDVTEDIKLEFTSADQPESKTWKALWIGVHEVTGLSPSGHCSSRFSKEELDAGFEFFQWSIKNHFEPFSYNTTQWEVTRKDIDTPIELYKASNTWFTLEPSSITSILPEIEPGAYDAVFVFWREKEGSCSFQSSYFGLAWTDPMNEAIKTGYITIKFDAGSNIQDNIDWYKNNDPGVWVHEWLHTVGENYFQDLGERLPEKGGDGLVLHAAEKYSYTYPWMDWYEDFMSGRVKDLGGGRTYVGIGPEAFLKHLVRETAVSN
jgi:hypothetical protein